MVNFDDITTLIITAESPSTVIKVVEQGPPGPPGEQGPEGPEGPPGDGSGASASLTASVVLYCPDRTASDITPIENETMWWVFYREGHVGAGDGQAELDDWYSLTSFDWTEGWSTDNDPTNVLLMFPGEEWPTVLAEVVPTGFTAIDVLGGQQITIGCGGAGFGWHSIWVASNDAVSGGIGALDPTAPATSFQPQGIDAGMVEVGGDDSGWISLRQWMIDNPIGAPTIYYDSSIAVQPWVQTDADFGVSSTVTAHGHVTRTNPYWAEVTLTFHSVVDVTTPGTGAPQFLVRKLLGSFDADFSNWYWGWSTPSDLRCSVWGQIAGLPFTGFVSRQGYILDANGDTITRVLVSGDYLRGTVTGVFQND